MCKALASLLALLFALHTYATPAKRAMAIDDQFRFSEAGTPLLSPDARWVLFPVSRMSLDDNKRHTTHWIAPADGSAAPRQFLAEGQGSPIWSASSRSIFFARNVEGRRQLFEKPVDGDAVQRSAFTTSIDPWWQLARDNSFLLIARSEEDTNESDVVFVDESSNGQTRNTWSNLWRYDLATKALTRITARDWSIEEFDLSPDGKQALVAARPDNRRNTRGKTELYAIDLATGAIRQLTHNDVPEAGPIWSPDGKSILFSAVSLARWEHGNGDLWLLDVASGATRNLTPKHTGRFVGPQFTPDGKSIVTASGFGTTRFPVRLDVASGTITPLVTTDGNVRVGSWSADRRTYAYTYQDFTSAPEVYVAHVDRKSDRQTRITNLNPWIADEIELGSVQRVEWPSFDGKRIEGLLHLPAKSSNVPRPLIVHVPCGPGCAWLNTFSIKTHVYAGLGYAQLSPNIRGANNYDDAHMQGNRFDIGGGDRLDLMSGVDAMIARNIADPKRLALSGWSYGGVLGGYTITQTPRFAAAILGAMVSDWPSEYGAGANYDMELWYIGGDPWTNAAKWRERSPLTHANGVKTPTLLHHGDEDEADSPFHSMNFFAALRRFGTPARLIRYPGEPHDLQQPRHIRLRDQQDIAWMEWYLNERGTAPLSDAPRAPSATPHSTDRP